jgi:PAS domain S-box-containing protein
VADALDWYRDLFALAPDAYLVTDAAGAVRAANRAAERLLGARPGGLGGTSLADCVAAEDREAFRARLAAAAGGEARGWRFHLSAAGEEVPVDASVAAGRGWRGGDPVLRWTLREAPAADGDDDRPVLPNRRAGDSGRGGRPSWSRDEAYRTLASARQGTGDVLAHVRDWLAVGLHLGYVRAGDRLLSIREVTDACGVDHRAVSVAYRTLAQDGLVEVRNRHGVFAAGLPHTADGELGETAEWLSGVLAEACDHQVRVPLLPDLVRDWTAAVPLSCACVESTEDDLVTLTTELRQQWGLETFPVTVRDTGAVRGKRVDDGALTAELRKADLVVTTPFHASAAGAVARTLGKPLVVMRLNPDVVTAVEERVSRGPLTAVVADAAYGERLRCIRGAEAEGRLNVVLASDAAAVAALDRADPVLLTRAAQQRLGPGGLRLLVPLSPFLCPTAARQIADVLIRHNVQAGRR